MKCLVALALILSVPSLGCARPEYVRASDSAIQAQSQATVLDFPQAGLEAVLSPDAAPTSAAENKFTLKFFDSSSGATADAGPYVDTLLAVNVLLWMPVMGHGSSPVTLSRTAAGVYEVTRAYFIMPGDWQIRVQLKNATTNSVIEEADISVKIP
jgi:hypothetical protein